MLRPWSGATGRSRSSDPIRFGLRGGARNNFRTMPQRKMKPAPGVTSRLAALERDRGEWSAWIAMAREIARALESGKWERSVRLEAAERAKEVPLLEGATIRCSFVALADLARRLARAASKHAPASSPASRLAEYRPSATEVGQLASAALTGNLQVTRSQRALASLAWLATLPILAACLAQLGPSFAEGWSSGYCPLCGAWPLLVEMRGLDRSRHLRCGRCSSDWTLPQLLCPYCGEKDHRKLGFLGPQGELETKKIETCSSCGSYLKSVASLLALQPLELLLTDLETVELDLAAWERGYRRPPGVGYQVALTLLDLENAR